MSNDPTTILTAFITVVLATVLSIACGWSLASWLVAQQAQPAQAPRVECAAKGGL